MLIAAGNQILLRDPIISDADRWVHWQTHGEWHLWDAPWEDVQTEITEQNRDKTKKRFLEQCAEEFPSPRKRAFIATHENMPLGWVTRYTHERFPDTWFVGIDICEDVHLGNGIGTKALELWVDYLFSNSTIHRIGLDTWSFNKRMIHVAEKIGFVFEGAQREMIQWQDEWLDWVHFGILRRAWKA